MTMVLFLDFFSLLHRLLDNYYIFQKNLSSLQISDSIDNLSDKWYLYFNNNNNEDENDKIYDELNNITKEYATIVYEADENAK